MQSYVLVALLAAFIHAFSSVYSKRLYVLADHPAQVAFYSLFSTGLLCGVVLVVMQKATVAGRRGQSAQIGDGKKAAPPDRDVGRVGR